MLLPDTPDAIAPDGSQVRVLLRLDGGSMAHFGLAAGQVSRAVAHHAVDELWYVVSGHGQMWRCQRERQETVPLRPGTCLSIPAGTHFQFRGHGRPAGPGPDDHRRAVQAQVARHVRLRDQPADHGVPRSGVPRPGVPRPGVPRSGAAVTAASPARMSGP